MTWIGVDLDGCLAEYDRWQGVEHIGKPIPLMIERIKQWLADGREVRIFTARVAEGPRAIPYINVWCQEHIGQVLTVTNVKDYGMIELWDDRAIQVEPNTGRKIEDVGYERGKYDGYREGQQNGYSIPQFGPGD